MEFLLIGVGVLVLLIAWGAVSDVRARRRGQRQDIDGRAVRDRRQLAESDLDVRTNGRMRELRDQPWNGSF